MAALLIPILVAALFAEPSLRARRSICTVYRHVSDCAVRSVNGYAAFWKSAVIAEVFDQSGFLFLKAHQLHLLTTK